MESDAGRAEIYTQELTPYVDLLTISEANVDAAAEWLSRVDASAALAVTLGRRPRRRRTSARAQPSMRCCVSPAPTSRCSVRPADRRHRRRRCESLVPAAALLSHEIDSLTDAGVS